MTFCITGSGRCGTMWLAHTMNRSPSWTVAHEPDPYAKDPAVIADRFRRERYGEVNSRLRRMLFDLPVDRRGVIVRCPFQTWLSIAHRKPPTRQRMQKFAETLSIIEGLLVGTDARKISFRLMTSDTGYLNDVLRWAGIDDYTATDDDLQRVMNQTTARRFTSARQFPKLQPDLSRICRHYKRRFRE